MRIFRRPRAGPEMAGSDARRKRASWSYAGAAGLPALIILTLGFVDPPFLRDLGNIVFDGYQRLAPRQWDAATQVRIVDVDDESLARLGQWPWPRSIIAALVARLGDLGAAALAFDVVLAEPDAASPESVIRRLPTSPARDELEHELAGIRSNDDRLADVIASTPTVLGTVATHAAGGADLPIKFGIATLGDDPRRFLPSFTGAVVPLPSLSRDSAGVGALNWLADRDQVVRRVPLLVAVGDR